MPTVFVHGVPESAVIWNPILDALEGLGHSDIVRLSPPGFGAPLPGDFGATVEDYRAWLIAELERFSEPVDLVGHDFGGGHVIGVAIYRPDLIRSWVVDIIGILDPDYEWHPFAQIWQKPVLGEAHLEALFSGSAKDRAPRLEPMGLTDKVAEDVAAAQGPDMARAILALYRSAPKSVLARIHDDLPRAAANRGLAILATEDLAVGSDAARRRMAERAGATVAVLEGQGHTWMLDNPLRSAQALSDFWAQP
ncbi:alpha/beta fold hydrolase [soil metagenome]